MEYISVAKYAEKFKISERTVRNWCQAGKIDGAFLTGRTWNIPDGAPSPRHRDVTRRQNPWLYVLRDEQKAHLNIGIYHITQIDFAYHSCAIDEGGLTREQVEEIFTTEALSIADGPVKVNDIVETANHFRCFDFIVDHAEDVLTEPLVKELHKLLKQGTADSFKKTYNVGDYKQHVGKKEGALACKPKDVHGRMVSLLSRYNAKPVKTLDDILSFHLDFEQIHPFQSGNGKVGRLLIYKECLAAGIAPFVLTEKMKYLYATGLILGYHGLEQLQEASLSCQDEYIRTFEYV